MFKVTKKTCLQQIPELQTAFKNAKSTLTKNKSKFRTS